MGPIKYVIIKGTANKILLIENLLESLTIHPPVNRLIEIKWIQNIIKYNLLSNKLDNSSIPRYRLKLFIKSYEFK